MPTSRPFRFGVFAMQLSTRAEWIDFARRVEDHGYSTLAMGEHIATGGAAPLPALMAAAAATTRLRIATHVLVHDFRNPVVLAQEAATLDQLSEGRLELGIGAGWFAGDYTASGIPFDAPLTRIRRLEEAVALLKQLFGGSPVTFEGEFYSVRDMRLTIMPHQQPFPPLYIGGGGKRVLTLAAHEADIVGVSFRGTAAGAMDLATRTAQAFDEKLGWLRAAAGERWAALELNTLVQYVQITDQRRQSAEQALHYYAGAPSAMIANPPQSVDEILEAPYCLIGTVEQIVQQLQERRERYGISYITVHAPYAEALAPVVARLAGT